MKKKTTTRMTVEKRSNRVAVTEAVIEAVSSVAD